MSTISLKLADIEDDPVQFDAFPDALFIEIGDANGPESQFQIAQLDAKDAATLRDYLNEKFPVTP
jgi:hypothetical protein